MNQNKIQINICYGKQNENIYLRGTMFEGPRKLDFNESAKRTAALRKEDVKDFLTQINGFYSIVSFDGEKGWMAVDRLRTMPIFYGTRNDTLFISDNARWVLAKVEEREMDPVARQEFLLAGYVTGSDTLFSRVKQLQAGELSYFHIDAGGRIVLYPERYFRYIHHDYYHEDETVLQKSFDDALLHTFNRLFEYAAGRTIVIPLSGGYDSRLIVLMLKRMGYQNVITFSYGRPGNQEAAISKHVAEQLGMPWVFVSYSDKHWYDWYRSPEMHAYLEYADGLCSMPHNQDWPAVWALKRDKRIPEDSVFVPGHSADLPAGSRSKTYPALYQGENILEETISSITSYHYTLSSYKNDVHTPFCARERILKTLGELDQYPDTASIFESWDITERQPKFIINSLRIYEYWGYDWWIPFWDNEFVAYWQRIPPEKRLNQWLYIRYVNAMAKDMGLVIEEKITLLNTIMKLNIAVKKLIPSEVKKMIREYIRYRQPNFYIKRIHRSDFLSVWGCHSEPFIIEAVTKYQASINGAFSLDRIFFIEQELRNETNKTNHP